MPILSTSLGRSLQAWTEKIGGFANPVAPTAAFDIIKHDPPDNRILECAATADSDYIVTAAKDQLRTANFEMRRF